jgi:hypothetical protein
MTSRAASWIGAVCIQLSFAALVFAGLGSPLFWYDEGETAMLGRRILEYGYPKVHGADGNIVYAARHPISLATDASLDAYLNSPWGQYYVGALGVAWSDTASDLHERTRRVRLPFAIAGWLGVLMLGGAAASLWPEAAGTRARFWLGYGLCLVSSVSLQLHLREARYYPLVVLGVAAVVWLEVRRHLRRDLSPIAHTLLLAPVLWWLFNLFYPAFAAVVTTAGGALVVRAMRSRASVAERLRELASAAAPYLLAVLAALPLVAFYRLPEQSRAFASTFDVPYNPALWRVGAAAWYLVRFELFVPAALAALALELARRRAGDPGRALGALAGASAIALLGTLVWVAFVIATTLFFERYLVALSPLLGATTLLCAGGLIALRKTPARPRAHAGLAVVGCALIVCAAVRAPELIGRATELRDPYRGPLDHVIPYLAERYPDPSRLVIATNYEEFSYMFYLGATVTCGFYAPDLARDLALTPDVIVLRPWPRHVQALEQLVAAGDYEPHEFPVGNVHVNNLPELSLNNARLVHRFRSPVAGRDATALVIGERPRNDD